MKSLLDILGDYSLGAHYEYLSSSMVCTEKYKGYIVVVVTPSNSPMYATYSLPQHIREYTYTGYAPVSHDEWVIYNINIKNIRKNIDDITGTR